MWRLRDDDDEEEDDELEDGDSVKRSISGSKLSGGPVGTEEEEELAEVTPLARSA